MGPRSRDAQRRWCLGHFGAVVLVVVSLFARWVWLHHLDRSGDTLATFRTAATRATLGATRLEHRLPTVSDSSRYCRLTFDMRDKERTETGGLNRTVRLVTFVDDESRCLYRRLNHSATSHGIHLENGFLAEEGHRWNPQLKGGARFDAALRFLGKLPPEELVLMLDGYDTVVLQPLRRIVHVYDRMLAARPAYALGRVVFGAEANFHFAYRAFDPPLRELSTLVKDTYPRAPTMLRHLQAGTVLGPAGELLALLTTAALSFGHGDGGHSNYGDDLAWTGRSDQTLLSTYYALRWQRRPRGNESAWRKLCKHHRKSYKLAYHRRRSPEGACSGVRQLSTETGRFCCLPQLDHCQHLFAVAGLHEPRSNANEDGRDHATLEPHRDHAMPLSVSRREGHVRNEFTDATPAVLHCPGRRDSSAPFRDEKCLESRLHLDPNWVRPSLLNCAEEEAQGSPAAIKGKQMVEQAGQLSRRQRKERKSKIRGRNQGKIKRAQTGSRGVNSK